MNHFTTSVLLLVAGLSATSAFAQSGPAPETSVVTARFAPAAPAEPATSELAATTATTTAASAATPPLVELTGYVLDARKQPMQGATVLLKGTTTATSTDATGHYVLQVPAGINRLRYDYVGCEGQELSASNFLPVTVVLAPASGKGSGRK